MYLTKEIQVEIPKDFFQIDEQDKQILVNIYKKDFISSLFYNFNSIILLSILIIFFEDIAFLSLHFFVKLSLYMALISLINTSMMEGIISSLPILIALKKNKCKAKFVTVKHINANMISTIRKSMSVIDENGEEYKDVYFHTNDAENIYNHNSQYILLIQFDDNYEAVSLNTVKKTI